MIIWLMSLMFTGEAKEIEVNALTLTGKSFPVFVEHDASVRMFKVNDMLLTVYHAISGH